MSSRCIFVSPRTGTTQQSISLVSTWFVHSFPNIFEKITGNLLPGAFCESIGSNNDTAVSIPLTASAKKKKRSSQAKRDDALFDFYEKNTKKSISMQHYADERWKTERLWRSPHFSTSQPKAIRDVVTTKAQSGATELLPRSDADDLRVGEPWQGSYPRDKTNRQ